MARDEDRDGVGAYRSSHCAGSPGPPDPRRELPVGHRGSIRNLQELPPHRALEHRALRGEGEGKRGPPAAEVVPELAGKLPVEGRGWARRGRREPGETELHERPSLHPGPELPPLGGNRRPRHGGSVGPPSTPATRVGPVPAPFRTMASMRVLAVGWEVEGRGVARGEFSSAESLASYDAVLIDPEPLPSLWEPHALLEPDGVWRLHPRRDFGLGRALDNLFSARRRELEDLLLHGGGMLVVRVRPPGEGVEIPGNPPHHLDRYAFLPRASLVSGSHHLGLPGGLRLVPRRGRDLSVAAPAHPMAPYLQALAPGGYEAVLVPTLGAPLASFGRVLATNRVGDTVAWDLPVGTGRILFLPSFPGTSAAETGEHLLPALASLLAQPLPEDLPDWASGYPLPGEEALPGRETALARKREALEREEEELRAERWGYDLLRGLLSPRGRAGLAAAAGAALSRLGFSVSPAEEDGGTLLARGPEGELLVRVALSPFGPVGPEEHRALLLALDERRSEKGEDTRGLLLVVAEPRLDPRRRGPQWTEAVERGCRDHGLRLAAAYDLFKAVRHVLGGGDPAEVRGGLLAGEGAWQWRR